MKFSINHSRFASAAVVLLLLILATASHSTASPQSSLLLEIVYKSSHPSIPISETYRVYRDGRCVTEGVFIEKAKSGRPRKVFIKSEKQLESEEIAELVSWTEQADFRNAQPEYAVTTVIDYPDWFVVTRYGEDKEKSIKVINFSSGNEAQRSKVPPSVFKLLKWAKPQN